MSSALPADGSPSVLGTLGAQFDRFKTLQAFQNFVSSEPAAEPHPATGLSLAPNHHHSGWIRDDTPLGPTFSSLTIFHLTREAD